MSRIVVDTSALASIFLAETGSELLERRLGEADKVVVPVSCLVEAALLQRIAGGFFSWIENLIDDEQFELGEITTPIARLAANAAQIYGEGTGHPARLNFGDCLSFAVATHGGLPLLYAGNDFSKTPLRSAIEVDERN